MEKQKHKHLTLEERIEIQECLDRGMTFKAIGKLIGKDQTTVSKEVKKHITYTETTTTYFNTEEKECPAPTCSKLLKAPFVCNPCDRKRRECGHRRQKYVAKFAQREYEKLLVEAREGIPLNKEEFYEADRIIAAGIRQGQHLYHIMSSNELKMSKSAVYRNLHKGYLSVSAIDLPRVVKFKPRKQKPLEYIPKALKVNRTYTDFRSYTEENGITSWVEMDTLIGIIGGKLILTLHFTFCNFMAGILLDDKTSAEVSSKIISLKRAFENEGLRFGDVIPLFLTDNGGEFADVFSFEQNLDGVKESSLFFCDPMQSCQKPKVEKNHTLFRDIVPKGSSFNHFTQDTVNMIFSHINSINRKSLNGKSPFELFVFTFSEKIALLLGVKSIPPHQVVQSPILLTTI